MFALSELPTSSPDVAIGRLTSLAVSKHKSHFPGHWPHAAAIGKATPYVEPGAALKSRLQYGTCSGLGSKAAPEMRVCAWRPPELAPSRNSINNALP
jgi:hypothetical protein